MFGNGHCVARKAHLIIHIPPRVYSVSPVLLATACTGEQARGGRRWYCFESDIHYTVSVRYLSFMYILEAWYKCIYNPYL